MKVKNLTLLKKDILYIVFFDSKNIFDILSKIVKVFTKSKINHTGIAFKYNKKDYIIECKIFSGGNSGIENIKNKKLLSISIKPLNYYNNYKGDIIIKETDTKNNGRKILNYFNNNKNNIQYSFLVASGCLSINNKYLKWLEKLIDKIIKYKIKKNKEVQCCSVNSSIILEMLGSEKIKELIEKKQWIYNITPIDLFKFFN